MNVLRSINSISRGYRSILILCIMSSGCAIDGQISDFSSIQGTSNSSDKQISNPCAGVDIGQACKNTTAIYAGSVGKKDT